jgi:methionine-rich copper-binding protein CopC
MVLAVTLLLSGVLLVLTPATAAAHDNVLTSSDPPASATLATPPQRVVLNFKWRVQPGSATVTVIGPDGASQWQEGETNAVDHSIGVALRELGPPGRYEVRYAALTGRGHPFQGTVAFTLLSPAPTPSSPPSAPEGDSGVIPPLSWFVAVLLLTAAGAVVGVRLNRDVS